MSEFQPIRTVADLDTLDDDDIVAGYRAAFHGEPEPGSDKSRSYWHGWRNGRVDSHRAESDDAQRQLVREIVGTYKGLH